MDAYFGSKNSEINSFVHLYKKKNIFFSIKCIFHLYKKIYFFYKCISIKVTEPIVNPVIVFTFKLLKNEEIGWKNYKMTGVVINMQNTAIFEPVILTGFYSTLIVRKDF